MRIHYIYTYWDHGKPTVGRSFLLDIEGNGSGMGPSECVWIVPGTVSPADD